MHRRADPCAVAAAWLAGAMLLHQLPALPAPQWGAAALLAGILALGMQPARAALVLAVLGGFCWTWQHAATALAERLPRAALGKDFPLTGWIDGFPSPAQRQSTFSFTVAEPRPAGVPARVRLTWYDPPGALHAGDALRIVARLRPPRGTRNPGGFDYARWLMIEGIGATGYVRSGQVIDASAHGLAQAWQRYRAGVAARIATAAEGPDSAALITALALGERYLFTEQHWSDFRRTGTSHLVAVSGMHVALLGLVVFIAVRRCWLWLPMPFAARDLQVAATGSALATCYYAALTGFALPAQRSLLMILVALAIVVSRRSIAARHGVAAALLAVLVFDPFAPLTAAFWLSFGAVAALILIAMPRAAVASGPRARGAWLREYAGLQWAIGWVLLPFTAAFFAEVALLGPLVNFVAIPVFNLLLVPLTVLVTLLLSAAPLAAFGAALIDTALAPLAEASVAALHAAASLPWAALAVPTPSPAAVLIACAGVALALAAPPMPARRLAWLALLPLFAPRAPALPHGTARLVVLDVGHGLAVAVETRSHRLLFDAGPAFPSGFDSGEAIVAPALRTRAYARLDTLVVSHADNDHAGGAAAVLTAYAAARVLKGPDVRLAGTACERGARWTWDGVALEVLHPPAGFAALGNESSCVLKITAASGAAALVTGDIERRAERALTAAGGLGADVVVVPHHGSATSSSPQFVRSTGARYALVSAAHANRWGFPRAEVRARWEEAGARLYVTGDDGALTVVLDANGAAVIAERERRHYYWEAAG